MKGIVLSNWEGFSSVYSSFRAGGTSETEYVLIFHESVTASKPFLGFRFLVELTVLSGKLRF